MASRQLMSDLIYEHKNQGNLLYSLGLLVSSIICVVGGSMLGQPIFIYMPIGTIWLFCAWYFMSNPNHGCTLNASALSCWSGKQTFTFAIDQIDAIVRLEDGSDDFELISKDGQRHSLSSLCIGSGDAFISALGKAGIATDL